MRNLKKKNICKKNQFLSMCDPYESLKVLLYGILIIYAFWIINKYI